MFSRVWSIGKYDLFISDVAKQPSFRVFDENIELRGAWHLHPTTSAKRICKSSMKADTVLGYLQRMMNPARQSLNPQKRAADEDELDEQQLSEIEEEKRKEMVPLAWRSWN